MALVSAFLVNFYVCLREQEDDLQGLHGCLRHIFIHAEDFGASIFSLAASMVSDMIHHDPLCFKVLAEAELPEAFIFSIKVSINACSSDWMNMGLTIQRVPTANVD